MRRTAFTLIQVLVLLIGLGVLAVIIFPIFGRSRGSDGNCNGCPSNLKQIALGMRQYIQDYNGRFPQVSSKSGNWAEVIQPYIKSTQLFQCNNETTAPTNICTTDYFFNGRLDRLDIKFVAYPMQTLMNGDGAGNAATDAHISDLPYEWTRDSTSPARRHKEGTTYSFADGHVKWLKPDQTSSQPSSSDSSLRTFAIN